MVSRLTLPALLAALGAAALNGCAGIGTSRWAMDDDVYAQKYSKPYPSNDGEKVTRMLKQASDARYVADRDGWYLGLAGATDPGALGAEIGRFTYTGSAFEGRLGLKALAGTGAEDWFAGLDLGARVQSPSRLAPFAGIGTYLGANNNEVPAVDDRIDNDNDGSVDERGEKKDDAQSMASIYPELGVHYWLTSSTRMTASAQYHITTDGRDSDFWFLGISFSFLDEPKDYKPLDE